MTLSVRGRCLPDGVERTVFIDGDRITFDSVPGAELVHDGGWIVPALVDVHTHPGAHEPGDPMDDVVLFDDLAAHVAAGVAVIRTPGIASGVIPPWAVTHEDLPRIVGAGHWLASADGFFDGWGRHLEPDELPGAAVEEATRSGGWCKVIVDWVNGEGADRRYEPSVPADVVVDIVHAVHDVGGRVAVHSQHPDGAEAAVVAGADSLEHGMHLRHELLERMAAQGTVLVPTMTAFEQGAAELSALDQPTWLSRYMTRGCELHPRLVRSAFEAGVTVLAGTDSTPHGNVANEVRLLADAGLPNTAAIAAASWTARSFLGLTSLQEGAPADLVIYDTDPTVDIAVIAHPVGIITKGRARSPRPHEPRSRRLTGNASPASPETSRHSPAT